MNRSNLYNDQYRFFVLRIENFTRSLDIPSNGHSKKRLWDFIMFLHEQKPEFEAMLDLFAALAEKIESRLNNLDVNQLNDWHFFKSFSETVKIQFSIDQTF